MTPVPGVWAALPGPPVTARSCVGHLTYQPGTGGTCLHPSFPRLVWVEFLLSLIPCAPSPSNPSGFGFPDRSCPVRDTCPLPGAPSLGHSTLPAAPCRPPLPIPASRSRREKMKFASSVLRCRVGQVSKSLCSAEHSGVWICKRGLDLALPSSRNLPWGWPAAQEGGAAPAG